MADITRVLVYSPQDVFITDLSPNTVFERLRTEVVNGEHSLTLTTIVKLAKEQRILTCDATEKWREYVVVGEDAEHTSGKRSVGTYYVTWSLQHDLQVTTVSGVGSMPGIQTPVSAAVALAAALSGTNRWSVGTVTQSTTGGASMDNMSGWEALGVLVKVWGGEVDANITVDSLGVVTRSVDLLSHLGAAEALRRFDYARDLLGIRRKVSEDPLCCRIIPLGKGEETESGGYGRKITIASVNGGVNYLQNDNVAELYRLPDGQGGFEYPTLYVENSEIDDKNELKAWGLSVLDEWTLPKVTYEASVLQLAQAGMDIQGIGLGDEVQCVDRAFSDDGLRITGRVVKLVTNELDPSDVRVTIGNLGENLQDVFIELKTSLSRTRDVALAAHAGTLTTAEYLSNILDNLNQAINANGGFAYVTDGHGILTYDCAVSDPLVGAEAHQAVEIKGGSIRIANSKDGQGQWQWRTVFTSGHIAADMVTTAHLTAGYIGNASGDFYIDLDNNIFRMPATSVGSTQLLDDTDVSGLTKVAAFANRYFSDASNTSIMPGFYPCTDPPISGLTTMQRYIISTAGNTYKDLVFYNSSQDAIEYEDGETYTVSCYARVVSGTKAVIEMRCTALGVLNTQGNIEITNSDWAQYHWTAKANAALGQFKLYVGVHGTYAATVEICGIKLERGSNATDWMPSVADLLHSMATAADVAVDTQTQSDIFNKLTDNGALQGLYMQGGQLLVNASYIQSGMIAASFIDAAQLIAGKVGNSPTDYAAIGTFEYQNRTFNGIKMFTGGGSVATMIFGVCDDAQGTYAVWGIGMPDGNYWPLYFAANGGGSGGPTAFIQPLATLVNGNYLAPCLQIDTSGIYARYGSINRTICTFT